MVLRDNAVVARYVPVASSTDDLSPVPVLVRQRQHRPGETVLERGPSTRIFLGRNDQGDRVRGEWNGRNSERVTKSVPAARVELLIGQKQGVLARLAHENAYNGGRTSM